MAAVAGSAPVRRIGVAGAGTMGIGIAQLACIEGFETYLHDPIAEALRAGEDRLRAGLLRGVDRGLWSKEKAEAASARLRVVPRLDDLAGCELVIEAAPENLDLKRELFARLADACGPRAILATNTSSLSVTAIAAGIEHPDRVCGMHFFNPPTRMRLVEVVSGEETSEATVAAAIEVVQALGRVPIRAADALGFVANRVARPFGLEALRLLGEGISSHDQIDRVVRVGGGFPMGPFELMDLVGVDINFEVAKSFWKQSFHEPRWQPHPIQARMVAARRLGRKAGRGYYDYGQGPHRTEDPPAPAAESAGLDFEAPETIRGDGFLAVNLERGSLGALGAEEGAVGFVALPDLASASVVELAPGRETGEEALGAATQHFAQLGKHVERVLADAPGLILGRILCQLVNEAYFAVQQGVAAPGDIDTAMRLGFNWPRGPFQWAEAIGPARVLSVLDALRSELGEERYRAAPRLRREAGPPRQATSPRR